LFTVVILFQAYSGSKSRLNDFYRGLVLGLALGNHLTTLFLIPLLIWDGKTLCPELHRHLPSRILGVLVGGLIYLLLPIWASGNPPINWGNPVTLKAFFALVSGEIYQSNFTLAYSIDRLRGLVGQFREQFGLTGLAIGLFYLLGGWVQIKKTFPLVWIFFVYCVFAIVYGSFDSYVYLIPPVMAFSIYIGFGIQEITQFVVSRWQSAWIAVIISILVSSGLQNILTIPGVDASKDQRAEVFGREILKTLPHNAMIITEDDEATFALWYFHYALKMRDDIAIVVNGLLPYDWYTETLKRTYPDLLMPQTGNGVSIDSINEANPSRPMCRIKDMHSLEVYCSTVNP
jgi:hypothetical protein